MKPRIRLKHAPAASVTAPASAPVPSPRAAGFGFEAPYRAGDGSGASEVMVNWNSPLRHPDREVNWDRDRIVGRARDIVRNNGWLSGAVAREVDGVVGAGFRPLVKPDWRALGLTEAWADDWKRTVEAQWRAYAEDPRCLADASRALTLPRLFGLAYRSYLIDGEALALVAWEADRPTSTVLRVLDPDLMSNPLDAPDDMGLRGGVEVDAQGAALAYHFRQAHEHALWADPGQYRWVRVARETAWGRPNVLHFYDKHRDGQTRGVSRLAPILEKIRQEDHYARVELEAAIINAVLAAFIRSPMDSEGILDMLSDNSSAITDYHADRAAYHGRKGDLRLNGAQLPHLYPGEEIGTIETARPAAQFADFETAVLRHIAAGLGQSYEQLAGDWSQTNYSSARAALIEIWRGWTSRRIAFAQGFCQPFFMAWLEERIDSGAITLPAGAPDFWDNWASYARTKWIGPGRGFVDPVKEVQSAALKVAAGLSTLEDEAAELTGSDFGENMARIRSEIAAMPPGMLHPAQESFAKLLGGGPGLADQPDAASR